MTDIFDVCNVDDIPDIIKKDLNETLFSKQILELFDIAKRDLSVDEITVAYFRKFGEAKTKKQIMGKLYNMARVINPKIISASGRKGVYRKTRSKYDVAKD